MKKLFLYFSLIFAAALYSCQDKVEDVEGQLSFPPTILRSRHEMAFCAERFYVILFPVGCREPIARVRNHWHRSN